MFKLGNHNRSPLSEQKYVCSEHGPLPWVEGLELAPTTRFNLMCVLTSTECRWHFKFKLLECFEFQAASSQFYWDSQLNTIVASLDRLHPHRPSRSVVQMGHQLPSNTHDSAIYIIKLSWIVSQDRKREDKVYAHGISHCPQHTAISRLCIGQRGTNLRASRTPTGTFVTHNLFALHLKNGSNCC